MQQRASAALFLALLGLFGLLAISNISRGAAVAAFALLSGTLAAWYAATAIRRARRAATALPHGSVLALVIAGAGITVSVIVLAGFALFGKQLSAYSQCVSGANTLMAQQDCYSQLTHSLTATVPLRSPSAG